MEDIKEKTADELFEELGSKFDSEDNNTFILRNKIRYIVFLKQHRTLMLPCQTTMQELQAINKKCKELGWI